MKKLIKKTAKFIIPTKYHRLIRKKQNISTDRYDAVNILIAENSFIEVSWRDDKFGAGASSSLYVLNDEVLRFDCFGKDKGHFHASSGFKSRIFNDRIYFTEETMEEQINRAHFEIVKNLPFYLGINPFRKIRSVHLDDSKLISAADKMRDLMQKYRIEKVEIKQSS